MERNAKVAQLGPAPHDPIFRPMCGRVRLSVSIRRGPRQELPEAVNLADTGRSYPRLGGRAGVLLGCELLLRSDLAQAVDDAALRWHRAF